MDNASDAAVRAEVMGLVRTLVPLDANEREQIAEALAWLESGVPFCRVAKPATPPQHLVSYAALIDPKTRAILLVDHINAGLWLPCGGHVELDEHPTTTAAREVSEELAVEASFLFAQPIFITITETVGATAGHTDVSLWYALRGDVAQVLRPDVAEFRRVAWFGFDELPLERCDPQLGRFVAKLRMLLDASEDEIHPQKT
jgi:8-oxo-dGTP diphosphatase